MAQARRLLARGVSQVLGAARASPLPCSFTITRGFGDTKLFVGGLSFRTTEDSLRSAFQVHGEIMDARIITDRETGRSRGFGFVTYYEESHAESALSKLNGQVLDGRTIRVDRASARPPANRGAGGAFGDTGFAGLANLPPPPTESEADWGSIPDMSADLSGGAAGGSTGGFGGSTGGFGDAGGFGDSGGFGNAPGGSGFGDSDFNNRQ